MCKKNTFLEFSTVMRRKAALAMNGDVNVTPTDASETGRRTDRQMVSRSTANASARKTSPQSVARPSTFASEQVESGTFSFSPNAT